MKLFEVEVKTAVKNIEDKSGNWFYYYKAESEQEAINKLTEETNATNVKVKNVVNVKAVG